MSEVTWSTFLSRAFLRSTPTTTGNLHSHIFYHLLTPSCQQRHKVLDMAFNRYFYLHIIPMTMNKEIIPFFVKFIHVYG